MKNLNYLNKYRVDMFGDGYLGDEHNGAFKLKIKGGQYFVIASDGKGWEHISITHTNGHKMPSWNTMCELKDMFFEDYETVMQLHPAKKDYVNNHKHCLHLWRPIDKEIPLPPKMCV